jgi:flavin-dependent dehydrogenase
LHDARHGRDYSVLIIGGGPAGLATAIELGHRGIAAIVVERSAYNDNRIGEHLTPAGVLQLKALDSGFSTLADLHGESAGITAYWGSTTANHTDYFLHPGQRGLNLSRPRFDADLARVAESLDVTILRLTSLKRAVRSNGVWLIDINRDTGTDQITVPFIVDATGRLATFSRQQGSKVLAHDRQVAVVAFQDCATEAHSNTRSIVEAAENGWWYFAPLNTTRSMCMFATDNDLLPQGGKRELHAWWLQQLGQADHMPAGFREVSHSKDFFTRSARSQCLDVPFGSGWLAVGDAAMAIDPLASQGIAKALDHGRRAAASISAYLKGEEFSLASLAIQLRREYAAFHSIRLQYFRLEQRWPRSIFWRRRNIIAKPGSRFKMAIR